MDRILALAPDARSGDSRGCSCFGATVDASFRSNRAAASPNASPTDDGGLLMSWTRGGHHLEIEVMPDATYEWFYRHRAFDIAEGGVERDTHLCDELIARLRQVIA